MRPTKYNAVKKMELIELYSRGYSLETIAGFMEVTRQTLHYWIKKYKLKDAMEEARENSAKECIEVGLRKLAAGSEEEVQEESFTTTRISKRYIKDEETGEITEEEYVQPVERTSKKKIKAPDSKSIEILARKYYKEYDPKAEEKEIASKILEGFTMRELQEARKDNPIDSGKYIEAEFTELSDSNSPTE